MSGSRGGPNEEENMKSTRFALTLVLMMGTLLLMGGCSKHYVDVYINEMCELVTLENGDAIDPLIVYPGDYVIFNSMRETKAVTLTFPTGMFEEDEVTIDPGKRVILKVINEGAPSGDIKRSGDCPVGDPKVKVGEDP
jgi:hypothetical protein